MKIYEIGTGYTPIPARLGAATEIVAEELTWAFRKRNLWAEIIDIRAENRPETDLPIREVPVPPFLQGTDVKLGMRHKLKRVVYSLSLGAQLRKILRHTKEKTVLHFHNQYNLFFFLLLTPRKLRKRALIAYTVHSGIWRQDWKKIRKTVRKRYFQEALSMKWADLVFVLNRETKENAVAHLGIGGEKITIIGNGINPDVYYPLEEKCERLILQVGSVCENKGQLRSAQLLLPLLLADRNLVYAYAGGIVEEDYQAKIRSFAQSYGLSDRIRYLGMIAPGKALNEWYNRAAATILPSGFEAFGLAAIESLAAGTPVLIDGESPMNFGPGCVFYDAARFEEAAGQLLDGDNQSLREAARRSVLDRFSWDRIAADYAAAFADRMKTL